MTNNDPASALDTGLKTVRSTAFTNTALALKASKGNLHAINIINPNATRLYLKLYSLAAGSVVVGTTVPVRTIEVPASSSLRIDYSGPETPIHHFKTAFSAAIVTTVADNGLTAPAVALLAEFQVA